MRLLLLDEDGFSGSSYYRVHQPFSRLNLTVDTVQRVRVEELFYYDIVLILRPTGSEDCLGTIKTARVLGIPVWADIDDDIFNIPPWNDAHFAWRSRLEKVKVALKDCDVITVTTEALARSIKKETGKDCITVPNAVDKVEFKPAKGPISIGWRGSKTHEADVETIRPLIQELSQRMTFHIFGYPFSWIRKAQVHQPRSFFAFVELYKKVQPTFLIHPLERTLFNDSKSNLAGLEAGDWGSAFVSDYGKEFDHPGMAGDYNLLLSDNLLEIRNERHQQLVDTINEKFTLDKINYLRKDIIYDLTGVNIQDKRAIRRGDR